MPAALMSLLDWRSGTFDLSAIAGPQHDADRALPITWVLLEHARLRDESSRLIRTDPAFRLRSLLTSDVAFS